MARHIVATVDDIPPGQRQLVTVKGREIGIFNVDGEYLAIGNRCPHEGASLCQGRIVGLVESSEPGSYRFSRRGELLRCPWHGWEFDLRTGKSWCEPDRTKVRSFELKVEAGGALVEGALQAETFPVSIEKQYVVIEV
jgi:nitrite reductase/ring-hydroxylating ferredoxin subunit